MKVIIDCDPGNGIPGANVDDAVALAFALRHPSFDVRAIWTVFGNTSAAEGYAAARALLASLNESVSLRRGTDRPSTGPDPLPGLVDDLIQAGDQVTLVCLGPLTNIARIMTEAPEAMAGVGAIHLMGGCLGHGELVDTNFALDPGAAEIVLASEVPLTITPLDVTRTTELSRADWQAVRHRAGVRVDLDAIGGWLEPWLEHSARTRPVNGMWLHDLVVLAQLAEPTLATTERVRVTVAAQPRGKLVRDPDGTLVHMVTGIDNSQLIALWADTLGEDPR